MQDYLLLEAAHAAVAEYRERVHVSPQHPASSDTYRYPLDESQQIELTIEATSTTFDLECRLLVDGQHPKLLVSASDNGHSPAGLMASGQIADIVPTMAEILVVVARGAPLTLPLPILALQEAA